MAAASTSKRFTLHHLRRAAPIFNKQGHWEHRLCLLVTIGARRRRIEDFYLQLLTIAPRP
jgi:hypothetical protein